MSNIKNAIILFSGVAILLLSLDKCASNINNDPGNILKPEVIDYKVELTETRVAFEHYRDSTINYVHVTEEVPFSHSKPKVQYVFIDRDPIGMDLSDTNEFNIGLRTFYYSKKDSLLEYTIMVTSTERPEKVEIDYKVPQLTIKDSVYVKDSIHEKITEKVRVNQFYFGGQGIVYPGLQGLLVGVDVISKKGWQGEASVGIDFTTGSPIALVGYKKLLSFRKRKRK